MIVHCLLILILSIHLGSTAESSVHHTEEIQFSEKEKYAIGDQENDVISKCHCPPNTIFTTHSECVESSDSYITMLKDPFSGNTKSVNTSDLKMVISDVTCQNGKKDLILEQYQFDLIKNYSIIYNDIIIQKSEYCLEFVDKGIVKMWIAQVCIQVPQIRKCCPEGFNIDETTFLCQQTLNNSNSINYDNIPMNITHTAIGYEISDENSLPECEDGDLVMVSISDGELKDDLSARLHYGIGGIELDVNHHQLPYLKHYEHNQFCVTSSVDSKKFLGIACYKNPFEAHADVCSGHQTCIRKCCKEKQLIDTISSQCRDNNNEDLFYVPEIFHSYYFDKLSPTGNMTPYQFIHGTPLCYDPYETNDNFYILDDGSVYLPNDHVHVKAEYYCVDNKLGYENETITSLYYCDMSTKCEKLKTPLTRILMGISIMFLGLTLMVCKIVPELHVYISGKNLITHVFSLLLAFICSMLIHVGELHKHSTAICIIMACLVQFFFLATFFWLNAMCFELWYPSRFRPTRTNSISQTRLKYKLHSIYGWGVPSIIVFVTIIVDLSLGNNVLSVMVPHFGYPHCWFRDNQSSWLYFNGIILLLCSMNLFFFTDMAKIYIKQCMDSVFISLSRQIYAERVVLYLKLFLVMGVTWIFEQISEAAEGTACSTWIAFDVINLLRGPCVFLSVISTKTVIKKLKSRTAAWFSCKKKKNAFPSNKNADEIMKQASNPLPNKRGLLTKPTSTSSDNSYQTSDVQTEETSLKTDSFASNKELSSTVDTDERFHKIDEESCANEINMAVDGKKDESNVVVDGNNIKCDVTVNDKNITNNVAVCGNNVEDNVALDDNHINSNMEVNSSNVEDNVALNVNHVEGIVEEDGEDVRISHETTC